MEMKACVEKVFDIVSAASGIDRCLIDEKSVIGASGINSITLIEIIVKVEQEFNIEIDNEDLDITQYSKIDDLVNVIKKKI